MLRLMRWGLSFVLWLILLMTELPHKRNLRQKARHKKQISETFSFFWNSSKNIKIRASRKYVFYYSGV
jgi:hypothetical protein